MGGGALTPHYASVNYSKQEETNAYISENEVPLLYHPTGRRKLSASGQPSQSETVAAQPMRSLYTLDARLPPMDTLVITAPPNSPFFPIKASSPSWFSGFASDPP